MDGTNSVAVRISKGAEDALQKMLEIANKDFAAGRVSRSELVSWVLSQFEKHYLMRNLEQLRKDYFDPLVYLEGLTREVKAARASGKVIPDLAALLAPVTGEAKAGKVVSKSPRKTLDQMKDKGKGTNENVSSVKVPLPDGESSQTGN
jgi:hypothetical protein